VAWAVSAATVPVVVTLGIGALATVAAATAATVGL